MCGSSDVSRSFVPDSGLASTECRLSSVLGRAVQETAAHLLVDLCSKLFLRDCVAVLRDDVVNAADAKAFAKKNKFRLQVLTELDSLVQRSDDVCLGQELVRNELSGPCSNSKCDVSSDNCGNFGHRCAVSRSFTW